MWSSIVCSVSDCFNFGVVFSFFSFFVFHNLVEFSFSSTSSHFCAFNNNISDLWFRTISGFVNSFNSASLHKSPVPPCNHYKEENETTQIWHETQNLRALQSSLACCCLSVSPFNSSKNTTWQHYEEVKNDNTLSQTKIARIWK